MNEEKFTFELTVNEINLILEALGNMPYLKVVEFISNLREQYQKQVQEQKEEED